MIKFIRFFGGKPEPSPVQRVQPAVLPDKDLAAKNRRRGLSAAGFQSSILSDLSDQYGLKSSFGS